MKTQYLHDMWSTPDNSRLVSKQFSFRLPVHIAAKIAALGDIYPQKNRTQIVADLLSAAIDDLEKNLPYITLEVDEHTQRDYDAYAHHQGIESEQLYEIGGVKAKFRALANRYYGEHEKELGNESALKLYEDINGSKEYIAEQLK